MQYLIFNEMQGSGSISVVRGITTAMYTVMYGDNDLCLPLNKCMSMRRDADLEDVGGLAVMRLRNHATLLSDAVECSNCR